MFFSNPGVDGYVDGVS